VIALRPGSFAWLTWHELRLARRGRRTRGVRQAIGLALLAVYAVFGVVAGVMLMGVPIGYRADIGVAILAASVVGLSFMTTQAILGSQQTLYESRDLDLLFTAPIDGRVVLLAKLAGIAGAIVLAYAALLLPLAVPVAILGHPALLGVIALLLGLALTAAAIGIAITLVLARLVGPRGARTVGQVAAAVVAGALFLATQLSHVGGRRSSFSIVFEDMRIWGWGVNGWSGLPGHAAFGDPLSIAIVLAIGIALFAVFYLCLFLDHLLMAGLAALGLSAMMAAWLAPLILGALLGIGALVTVLSGLRSLRHADPKPASWRTVQSLKALRTDERRAQPAGKG